MVYLEAGAMVAEIIIGGTALVLLWGLWQNRAAFRLQKTALQAILFHNVSDRIYGLEDQWSEAKGSREQREDWYEKLFSAFEYFSFFANHGYLADEMKSYYKDSMKVYCKRLKKYPELLRHYRELPAGALNEFRKFYKDTWGEESF